MHVIKKVCEMESRRSKWEKKHDNNNNKLIKAAAAKSAQ